MTYTELAKKLKDSGFPGSERWAEPTSEVIYAGFQKTEPTLEELIEACGDNFCELKRDYHTKTWRATTYKFVGFDSLTIDSETPEEAVANLWLALYKKDAHTTTK